MKNFLFILLLVGVIIASVSITYAEETKDLQGIFEECGIGALLFPSWPVGASVSNVIWDLGTTASTSGLTTPGACKGGKAKLASYIYQSYDSIEKDLAKGDGKYLDMLVVLSENTGEKERFVQDLREKLRETVESSCYSCKDRLEKAKLMYTIIENLA
ncbi:MAG: DUF3015 family protein [Candidatus Omnitrophica bacterium]|nr:DUF3015 family protein [Candidatus Omnitrophota bacterium]